MICPKCGVEAVIGRASNVVRGTGAPEDPIRFFRRLQYVCRNKGCEACGGEPFHAEEIELEVETDHTTGRAAGVE